MIDIKPTENIEELNAAFKRHGIPIDILPFDNAMPVLCGVVVALLDNVSDLEQRVKDIEAMLVI